jgi:carbonic anhydrase
MVWQSLKFWLISSTAALTLVMVIASSASAQNTSDYCYQGGCKSGQYDQFQWNQEFRYQCGLGVRQSPFNIKTDRIISAMLPPLKFHYDVAHLKYLDHYDDITIDHGEGNYITIGSQRFDLIDLHFHTPGEYAVDGRTYPLELHFVHKNADQNGAPQLAVVGVFVKEGAANPGLIQLPSESDPEDVDFDLNKLLPPPLPFARTYWRFDGSLTTPGSRGPVRCMEGVLWTEMKTPITMSAEQIEAFKESSKGYWGTDVTNRPLQPSNGRYVLTPLFGDFGL